MKCNEFIILIDSYFRGVLPEEKQEEFELHYFECDDCYSVLKIQEQLHSKDIRITPGEKEVKKEIKKEVNNIIPIRTSWRPVLAIAAVLVIAVSVYFIIDHTNTIKNLYRVSEFNPPLYILTETRNTGTETSPALFNEAMKSYNNKDYSRALDYLDRIPGTQTNPQVIFFKGMCCLILDKKENAIIEFDRVLKMMSASYYDEAIYYKAIALLRMNKKAEALELLNNLSRMFSPLSPRAKSIIKQIQSI